MSTYYIGVMSGTSLDGVDVVLCEIDTASCQLRASHEHPFPEALKASVLHTIATPCSLHDIGTLHHRLGQLFAHAVTALLAETSLNAKAIQAIGLHGQTLWHEPHTAHPFSMQLGDAAIVAATTGIDVVYDFRSKDIALGGEGAPFAPAFHHFIFHGLSASTCILNIGGIANITLLHDPLLGYDTGPGNLLMDGWISRHHNMPYDTDGAWAQSGTLNMTLLHRLLDDPYFAQRAPKSTGREYFNSSWLHQKLEGLCIDPVDVQATLLQLTVDSIANALKTQPCTLLLVCGGGAKNSMLMHRLQEALEGTPVHPTDAYGVNSDFMEAMAFAWLAYKRIHREPVNLKAVTGARSNAILGGIYAGS